MVQGIVKTLLWGYIVFVRELKRWYPICRVAISSLFFLGFSFDALAAGHPCCPEDGELSYLLSPKSSQRFQYLVRYETFFSNVLGKGKGFFIILPEDFYQNPNAKYPVLSLLHGYNFERRGFWWKVYSPEKANRVLCEVKEEEYHWLAHEDIAILAYAMMDARNRTYRDLERSLEERFEELSKYGGLAKGDYRPKEIAQSIVSYNLHPRRNLDDPFIPSTRWSSSFLTGTMDFILMRMRKEGFPEVKNQKACDGFNPGRP
jgi:hypothetical protein